MRNVNGSSVAAGLVVSLTCLILAWSASLFAHHSLTEYDETQVKTVDGTVLEVLFKNPHSYLTIQGTGPDESPDRWTVEWLAALALKRGGVEHDTLKPGDRVVITGHPTRDRTVRRLWLRTVTRPADGWHWKGPF